MRSGQLLPLRHAAPACRGPSALRAEMVGGAYGGNGSHVGIRTGVACRADFLIPQRPLPSRTGYRHDETARAGRRPKSESATALEDLEQDSSRVCGTDYIHPVSVAEENARPGSHGHGHALPHRLNLRAGSRSRWRGSSGIESPPLHRHHRHRQLRKLVSNLVSSHRQSRSHRPNRVRVVARILSGQ